MALIDTLQRKFGRLAFPSLIQTIAVFWVLTYILNVINPAMYELMILNIGEIFKGQVWRLFTFILIAPASNPLFLFFAVYFTFFLGSLLESAWGPFRVNLYIFSGMVSTVLFCLAIHFYEPLASVILAFTCVGALSASVLLACACIYPEVEIRLMGIIPIKMKWLGFIDGGFLLLMALNSHWHAMAVVAGLLPFLVVFVPIYVRYARNRATAAARLQRFKADSRPEDASLHRCVVCHTTEHDAPELSFRVSGGEEYCLPCLEIKKKKEAEGETKATSSSDAS